MNLSLRGLLVVTAALLAVAASWPAAAEPIRIVALGDSLTAGWGLSADTAFPARLQHALAARGIAVEIANAGVNGDTATGGLARMDWAIPVGTEAVILELGGNDGLLAADPSSVKATLDQIIRRLKARNIAVLFCGIKAPRHYGNDYFRVFDGLFPQLAANHGLLFYPFFLDGVVFHPTRAQPDGIHPTAAGVDYIVARILPKAEELVGQVKTRRQIAAADREYKMVRQPLLTHIPELAKIIETIAVSESKTIPETANIPETTTIPQSANIAETANIPQTVNIPEAANILETRHIPEATMSPEAAHIPATANMTETENNTQINKTPETENIAETANGPEQ